MSRELYAQHERGALKYAFVAPALILLIAMNVFPLCYSVYLSFTDAELVGQSHRMVGGANYGTVFTRPEYARAIRTTAVFVLGAVSIETVLGFFLALLLKKDFPVKAVVLTVLLVPMMMPPAVMGLYWNMLLDPNYGIVNQILSAFVRSPPLWLSDPDLKLFSLILIDVWMWTPFMMLICLAGLGNIPEHVYEAAEIDRASRWTVFRRITLPMCAPLLFLGVLLRLTDALKQFDLVMATTGMHDGSTRTLSVLLYRVMFGSQKIGLGSAFSYVVLVVVIALAMLFIRYIGRIRAGQGAY